jgi:hypothetical protein
MAVILEVKAGPMAGEKTVVRTGETVTFGRAAGRANFALPHDTFMSGVHFAVECRPQGPVLVDRNSSNGTFLNGAKVKESPLNGGDEVRSGNTSFSVRLVADEKVAQASSPTPSTAAPRPSPMMSAPPIPVPAPRPFTPPSPPPAPPVPSIPPGNIDDAFSASVVHPPARPQPQAAPAIPPRPTPPVPPRPEPVPPPVPPSPPPIPRPVEPMRSAPPSPAGKSAVFSVGSWDFATVPQGWNVKAEFGIEQGETDGFPSSVTATEEMLMGGNPSLGPFVESQLSMLRQYLKDPKIEAVIPPPIPGAEEKASVDVRYSTKDGQTIFYRRLYARSGNTVGTITLMTLDSDLASVQPAFDAILRGAAFQVKAAAR